MGHEGFDARPVDDGSVGDPTAERAGQPSHQRPAGRVDGHDLPGAGHLGQEDLVGLDDPAADEVDGVAGQQVLGQQHLALAALEAAQVDPRAVEEDPARLEGRHLADGDEQVPLADGDDQAHDGRVG